MKQAPLIVEYNFNMKELAEDTTITILNGSRTIPATSHNVTN